MGNVCRFGPKGLHFKKPITITLPYEVPKEGYPEEFIHIYYYDETTKTWEVMGKVDQDFENNTITASIYHFSDYCPGVGSYKDEEGMNWGNL